MRGKKNDYSCSFFNASGQRVLFLAFVHDTDTAYNWALAQQIDFHHMNIYNRRTRAFIAQKKATHTNGVPK